MVRSMTGFGRAESQTDTRRVTVEIRSVNHRYFDFGSRFPNSLASLESRVRERVRRDLTRGKVHITAVLDDQSDPSVALRINEAVARRYQQLAQEVRTRYGIRGELSLESFLGFPDLLERETEDLAEEQAWALLAPPLDAALADHQAMRVSEGEAMARDLRERLRTIQEVVEEITSRIPDVVDQVRERLRERIAQISQDTEYNQQRLESEIVLFADRTDVTEECVRLRSHIDQFLQCLTDPQPAGRRLNFLLQETNREINTIGSKSQDLEISQQVIRAKEEVEKIREQVQNIE
ncbi:MAG: YicC family protein [Candidatus Eisenbacteria bacterium]|nr:YicC family protein [Candidatus Eisenbacteria bacterium]